MERLELLLPELRVTQLLLLAVALLPAPEVPVEVLLWAARQGPDDLQWRPGEVRSTAGLGWAAT